MMFHDYIIAEVRLRCNYDLASIIKGFKPFEVETDSTTPVATITLHNSYAPELKGTPLASSYLAEANADGEFIRSESGYAYIVTRRDDTSHKALFEIDYTTKLINCYIELTDNIDISVLRFGLWVMYGIVIAPLRGIAIHSSTIEYDGRCALFLGESGTGKSTHTRLWRENIEGARLLNDDSPIIRIKDGRVNVYGSPWSGKTPCYINRQFPVAGFVRLSQAPYNKIKRLNALVAIGALLPSCPHIFAEDNTLQDELCTTLSEVITVTPVYTLACLPNAEAAHLSHSTLFA